MSADAHEEDAESSLLLEDIQRRLRNAFRGTISSQDVPRPPPQEPRKQLRYEGSRSRARAVREELRRAHMDRTIAWLRAELLEIHLQNRQLAKTLVDLNLEMQRLKIENELSTASDYPILGKITVNSK